MVYETTKIIIIYTIDMDCITGWVWLEASWAFYAIAFYWRESISYFIQLKT